jgi:flagellar motility protein MotE (MotC chaperone)
VVEGFFMASLEHLKESLRMAKEERDRLNRTWWHGSAAKRKEELDRINEEIREIERKISNKLLEG